MRNVLPYGRQTIDEADIEAVVAVLRSEFLTQGPAVEAFEKALASYCSANHAIAFSSGTAALHAAYYCIGLKPDDEFITSPITFAATANAGLYCGAKPVFADVEPDTGNIDPDQVKRRLSSGTKLIVPVHYAGHAADMESISAIARQRNLAVIEDACHALGAEYRGSRVGSCTYSDMTVFSFHPVKHITTGEGGAVLTNSSEYAQKLRLFRTHGITRESLINQSPGNWYYEMQFLGYNYRLTDIQAALGMSQLKKLDAFVHRRREIAGIYHDAFADSVSFDIPVDREYARSSYHLYPIRLRAGIDRRKREIFSSLRNRGLGVQVHYIPVYLHPFYRGLGYSAGLCPSAEEFSRKEISLPLYPSMVDDDVRRVIRTVTETVRNDA